MLRSSWWELCLAGWVAGLPVAASASFEPAPQAFRQEVASQYRLPSASAGELGLLLVSSEGVLTAGGQSWYRLEGDRLLAVSPPADLPSGSGWLPTARSGLTIPMPLSSVRHVARSDSAWWVAGAAGVWRVSAAEPNSLELGERTVNQLATGANGSVWAATDRGLWRRRAPGQWAREVVEDSSGRDWAAGPVLGVAESSGTGVWFGTDAGLVAITSEGNRFFTPADGLPVLGLTCVAVGPEGEVWLGTRQGAIRFDGGAWAYREGPRWLPGNHVRAIAVDAAGTAWFATDGGLGRIERRSMTLAEKAAFYEAEIERCIKRTPFGYLSEVRLGAPGDRSQIIYHDSDNDGLWTAMYGAGECFAYGATRLPEFRERARQAFEALRFLQQVTQGGPHSPPRGFVARTIRPVEWPDPNQGRLEADRAAQRSDRLWKVYEPRWPLSADGQWYWKSDTSSDELDGHYFFYGLYYDLVAETSAERERVREVVRDLTDHLVEHDFCLVDHDGAPTRWARFGPAYLNHDPRWWVERGLNSLSILSYLAVAEHITGDAQYARAARDLIERHGYAANVMNPKVQLGIGSGNQSDDEMAFMCFYNLLRYTRDERWKNNWQFAFHAYWALEQPEANPFFNFAFAAHGLGREYQNAYGVVPIDPADGWLADAMATLRGFPLDRVDWPHRNSHRLDIRALPWQQSRDLADPDREGRGGRANGSVLPVEERHFNHWNTDPWRLDYGGDGRTLASGTVFLLPYYMGLYHDFIQRP